MIKKCNLREPPPPCLRSGKDGEKTGGGEGSLDKYRYEPGGVVLRQGGINPNEKKKSVFRAKKAIFLHILGSIVPLEGKIKQKW